MEGRGTGYSQIRLTLHEAMDWAASFSAQVAGPALPAMAQSATAGMVFMTGLAGIQYVGLACRVSCATPGVAPLLGGVGVGIVSAAAGQAGSLVRRLQMGEGPIPDEGLMMKEMIMHGLLGMIAFKALGGSFRSLLPSDLQHPGALARLSISARGTQYATDAERDLMRDLFRRFGCHHCGKRTGNVVSDHMPPSRDVYGGGWASKAAGRLTPVPDAAGASTLASRPWWRRLLGEGGGSSAGPRPRRAISGPTPAAATSNASTSGGPPASPAGGLSRAGSTGTLAGTSGPSSSASSRASSNRAYSSSSGQSSANSAKARLAPALSQGSKGPTTSNRGAAAGGVGRRRVHSGAAERGGVRVEQKLFPQCEGCSRKQSQAVKLSRRTLILHRSRGVPQPSKLAGFFVGLFPIKPKSPGGKTVKSWNASWAAADGPVAVLASRLRGGALKPVSRLLEHNKQFNAMEETARMREELTEKGYRGLKDMEEEVRVLRAREALVRREMKAKASARGDAHLGALQWMGENALGEDGQPTEDLEEELQRIAKRKERLKSEIRWVKQHLR